MPDADGDVLLAQADDHLLLLGEMMIMIMIVGIKAES